MRKSFVGILSIAGIMSSSASWAKMNWDRDVDTSNYPKITVCVGPEGSIYEKAAQIFAHHLENKLIVDSLNTKGPLGNLEALRDGKCDLAFTRSDTVALVNAEQTANNVSGTLNVRTLDDGTSDASKDPANQLLSSELECGRLAGVEQAKVSSLAG